MSQVLEIANALVQCPACGHSPYKHWKTKGNYTATGTEGLVNIWKGVDPKTGKEYTDRWSYASNESPGNLPDKGCFQVLEEKWVESTPIPGVHNCLGYNYFVFCDCPIDQETVLALVRQGKKFNAISKS